MNDGGEREPMRSHEDNVADAPQRNMTHAHDLPGASDPDSAGTAKMPASGARASAASAPESREETSHFVDRDSFAPESNGSGLPTPAVADGGSRFTSSIFRALLCLAVLVALFVPRADRAQSQPQQMQIIAGISVPQEAVTCNGPNNLCTGTSTLGYRGVGCRTGAYPLPASPIPICNTGYGGDTGSALTAMMDLPVAVTADNNGNVYVVDELNGVVRKIDSSGTISTVACVNSSGQVVETGCTIPNNNSPFYLQSGNWPPVPPYISAVAVDGQGNLQIGEVVPGQGGTIAMTSDPNGDVYALINGSGGGFDVTITKNGNALLSTQGGTLPLDATFAGLAADVAGNVYTVGTSGAYTGDLIEITPGGATSIVFNGSGQALLENMPANGLAMDANGNFYALVNAGIDGSSLVEEYNPTSQTWSIVAGTGTNGFNDGNNASDVAGFTNVGAPSSSAIDQPMPATSTDLNNATGIAISPDGALYIADSGNNAVRKIGGHAAGGCAECGPKTLAITDQISRSLPSSWTFDPTLHKLYMITSSAPGVVTAFNTTNDTVIDNIPLPATSVVNTIAVDSTNNLVYVPDTANNVLYVINAGTDQQVTGSPVTLPGSPGNIAVLPDSGNSRAYITIQNGGYSFPSSSLPAVAVVAGPSSANASPSYITGIGAYSSGSSLSGASAIVADPQRDKVYVRFYGTIGSESTYSLAVIDASSTGNNPIVTRQDLSIASFPSSIYSDSMAIDESTGNVLIGDDYDQYVHLFEYSTQTVSGFFAGYGGYNYHVAADGVNGIFYTWDGYGNVGYLIPNQTSASITSTSVLGAANESYVAVDSSTEQAYVMNCNTANSDGTLGTLTLWDGSKDSAITTLPLEIPSTATSEGCGSLFVDSSNSNPAAHSAWLSFDYGINFSTPTGEIAVINGPVPAARPAISVSPSALSFGTAGVGQGSFVTNVTIQNNGTAPLTGITPVFQDAQDPGSIQVNNTLSGPSTCGAPVAPGGSCVIFLQFTPSQVENFSGSILFLDNSPDTPQSVSVTGTGVPAIGPLTISPQAFPPGVMSQAYSQQLLVSGLVGAPSFNVSGSLPPGLSLNGASLAGTPTQAGPYNFTITATDTATGKTSSQFYSLTITSTAAGQTQASRFGAGSSGVISFGSIEFNEPSATLQTEVEDTGLSSVYANLQITGRTVAGPNASDFIESDNCAGQSISEFNSCTISVTFKPTVQPIANEVAQLILSSNTALQPIFLTGISAAPLGAPASLPVAVSVDNGNPPNLAATSNAGGCYPPECGGSGSSTLGAISSGGKFVGFSFAATNLPGPGPASSSSQAEGAYLRSTCVGATSGCEESTQYISYGPTSGPASNNGAACNTSVAGNANVTGIDSTGQYVLFESNACAFSGATSQNANQVFLRDVINGNTTLMSVDPTNSVVLSNGANSSSMSEDGHFFAFDSASTNADQNFTNPNSGLEVYWRGCTTRPSTTCAPSTVVVSQDNVNDAANDASSQPSISASGRFVAFASTATRLMELAAPLQNNVAGTENVFLWDSCAGTAANACTPHTILISQDANGNAVGGTSPSVSADGRFVVFLSSAKTLLPAADLAQYGGTQEAYLVDTCLSNGTQVSGCASQAPILVSQLDGVPGDEQSLDPFISADGSLVLFSSRSNTLMTPTLFNQSPVYKYTNCLSSAAPANCAASLQIISVDANGNPMQNVYSSGSLDPTGQYFLFGVQNSSGGYTPSTETYLGPTLAPLGPLTITTLGLPNTIVGASYSQTVSAIGAGTPATFAVTAGSLPPGLTLASNGSLTGTATTPGTYGFTITALGTAGQTAQQAYQVTAYPPLSIAPTSLPSGLVGSAYSQTLTATGGTGTGYTWSVSSGSALSAVGLTLSPAGLISGSPTATESAASVTVQVSDSGGFTGQQAYQLTVTTSAPTLVSIAVAPPNPVLAVGGTQQFTATGTYSDNSTQDLTSSVVWASSNTPVATISSQGGLATAVTAGSTTISATLGNIFGSTTLTVELSVSEPITVTDSVSVVPLTLVAPIQVAAPVAYFTQGSPMGFNSTTQSQQVVGIENVGAAGTSLTLSSVAISTGAPFSVPPVSCFNGATSAAIPSGGFCTVTVTYTGSSPTTDTGTLTFTDNAGLSNLNSLGSSPNFTQSITLNGASGITTAPAAPSATVSVPSNGSLLSEPITVTDAVTVKVGPIVTGVSPNSGSPAGGTSVTITGAGFTGATAVNFGSAPAANFTVNSDTQITTTSPAGAGTVDVTVTTPVSTSPISAADQFTYSAATYTVRGTVSGLGSGASLTLQNGTDTVTVTYPSATFTFLTGLVTGATYEVTIAAQPSGENCTVTNGSGKIASANVTNVTISCGSTVMIVPAASNPVTITTDASGDYVVNFTITNQGSATASVLSLSAAKLGSTAPIAPVSSLTNLAPGSSGTFVITFPASAGSGGSKVAFSASGTWTAGALGGSWNFGTRATFTLP